jgi:hypothetical protein
MYTGFRVRGRIKPEYRRAIEFALREHEECTDENHWCRAALEFPQLAELPNYLPFAVNEESVWIPGLFCNVGDWDTDDPDWQTSIVDGYLVLQSVNKNYDDAFGAFRALMPSLFDSVDHCEELYCERDIGALYALENGEMVLKAKSIDFYKIVDMGFGFSTEDNSEQIEKRWESPWMLSQKETSEEL